MDAATADLNKRLETVSWAFLIMIGGFLVVPDGRLPEGSWLVGVGVILLVFGNRCRAISVLGSAL